MNAVAAVPQGLRTLEDVVRYGLGLSPPARIAEVVTQDEYTLDVLLELPDGRWLVVDAS